MRPENMRKIGIMMSLLMGVTMSFGMSLCGSLLSGHFTVASWLLSFVISLAVSIILGLAVPVKRICDAACRRFGAAPDTMKGRAVSAMTSNLIYTPVLTVIMCQVMTSLAGAQISRGVAELDMAAASVRGELSAAQDEYEKRQAEGAAETELASLSGKMESLRSELEQMEGKRAAMMEEKPVFIRELWLSLAVCLAVGFVLIFLTESANMKLLVKKFAH